MGNHVQNPPAFDGCEINEYIVDDVVWLSEWQVGRLLKLKPPARSVREIYNAHKDYFTDESTRTFEQRRYFNYLGLLVLANHSNSKKTAEFCRWIAAALIPFEDQLARQKHALPFKNMFANKTIVTRIDANGIPLTQSFDNPVRVVPEHVWCGLLNTIRDAGAMIVNECERALGGREDG